MKLNMNHRTPCLILLMLTVFLPTSIRLEQQQQQFGSNTLLEQSGNNNKRHPHNGNNNSIRTNTTTTTTNEADRLIQLKSDDNQLEGEADSRRRRRRSENETRFLSHDDNERRRTRTRSRRREARRWFMASGDSEQEEEAEGRQKNRNSVQQAEQEEVEDEVRTNPTTTTTTQWNHQLAAPKLPRQVHWDGGATGAEEQDEETRKHHHHHEARQSQIMINDNWPPTSSAQTADGDRSRKGSSAAAAAANDEQRHNYINQSLFTHDEIQIGAHKTTDDDLIAWPQEQAAHWPTADSESADQSWSQSTTSGDRQAEFRKKRSISEDKSLASSRRRLKRHPVHSEQHRSINNEPPADEATTTKAKQQQTSKMRNDENNIELPAVAKAPHSVQQQHGHEQTTIEPKSLKCRVERDLYLDFEEYQHYTCAFCYNQVPRVSFKRKLNYTKEFRTYLWDRQVALLPNETQLIRETFKDESIYEKWQACCKHAVDCCLENARFLPQTRDPLTGQLIDDSTKSHQCPATWDGLTCWQNSAAGQVVWRECPRHVYFLSFEPACTGHVSKQCFQNGSWFIRNDHEWSDYSHCAVLGIYKRRMVCSVVWHIISALVITPALLTINKFSNRGGNKRVKILRNMLFWLLVNSCIQATQKSAIVSGLFEADRSRAEETPLPPPSSSSASAAAAASNTTLGLLSNDSADAAMSSQSQAAAASESQSLLPGEDKFVRLTRSIYDDTTIALKSPPNKFNSYSSENNSSAQNDGEHFDSKIHHGELKFNAMAVNQKQETTTTRTVLDEDQLLLMHDKTKPAKTARAIQKQQHEEDPKGRKADSYGFKVRRQRAREEEEERQVGRLSKTSIITNHRNHSKQMIDERRLHEATDEMQTDAAAATANLQFMYQPAPNGMRCKRDGTPSDGGKHSALARRQRSAMVVFFCWFLVVASRIVRLMGYSWMFTGAIYLCSALHFAPAEPPAQFIRILMFLTNAFPILIALIYVTSRTIVEPSPLNIIFKVPYFKLMGDQGNVDYLWATQLECWFDQSKYESIEEIADLPNLILVCLNVGLFIITLIILCRINRPGSTRPDMSPLTYFKAAGTLVVLYGGHYALLAYRPNAEGCTYDTFMFYAFLFVDGIQGIAVSYVFCYRTQEGKDIICKYWRTRHQRLPLKVCNCFGCATPNGKLLDNGHLKAQNRSNQSTRSNNSACNGHGETVTELININDTPVTAAANHQF